MIETTINNRAGDLDAATKHIEQAMVHIQRSYGLTTEDRQVLALEVSRLVGAFVANRVPGRTMRLQERAKQKES